MNGTKKRPFTPWDVSSILAKHPQLPVIWHKGFERVPFESHADLYVINTCSVTENADQRFKIIVKSTK